MIDIVDRFRDASKNDPDGWASRYAIRCGELREAANEIEQLRAAMLVFSQASSIIITTDGKGGKANNG